MIDFGTVRPGTTLYIPFATYDSNDPSASVTLTGLAVTDIEIYKNGSVTQRSSDSGYALLDTDGIDFDAITGIHGISIDLADNTDPGFYASGAQYTVVIASITVDAATINFIAATFRIGYPDAVLNTTIATLSSQTSFTLTNGPAEDDALNGCRVVIHDVASAVQVGTAIVSDYVGSTKTVTLAAGTSFTAAASDNISFYPPLLDAASTLNLYTAASNYSATRGLAGTALPAAAADAAGGLPISDAGGLDMDAILVDTNSLNDTKIPDTISLANINAQCDTALSDYDAPTNAEMTAAFTEIKGATWSSATDTLEALRDRGDAAWITAVGFSTHTAADVADAVWDELQSGHVTAGSFGEIATEIANILVDTTEIGAAGAGLTEAGGTGDQFTAIPWNAAWDAEVQSEVDDALDTAISELGVAAPAATPTLRTGLMLLYMMARNKLVVQTSGTDAIEVYNDAGTKIASKLITDDGSDYTEAEMA